MGGERHLAPWGGNLGWAGTSLSNTQATQEQVPEFLRRVRCG